MGDRRPVGPSTASVTATTDRSAVGRDARRVVDRVLGGLGRWTVLATIISVPIAVAAVRGIARGYLPIGDNALIEIRGRDVFTEHHPLLGTWSSASLSAGVDVNHPGPLIFDLVAGPIRLFGGGAGIAVAVAAFNIAMVWTIGAVAQRIGGARWAAVALVVTASMVWSLGSEMLYDPWQPNLLVLACLALLTTVWGVLAGHDALLIPAVAIASFAVQTHLGYVYLAVALVLVAAVTVLVGIVRRRSWRDLSTIAWSALVGLVAWSQPVVEQFTADRGNLGRLLTADTTGGVATGPAVAARLVAAVVALPPWWGRSGYVTTIPDNTWFLGTQPRLAGLVALGPAIAGLAVVVGGLIAVGWWRRERIVVAGVATALTGLVVGLVTVAVTPVEVLGISAHRIRWLWPLAAFIGLVLLGALLADRRHRSGIAADADAGEAPIADGGDGGRGDPVVRVLAVAVGVVAVMTLPTHVQASGPVASAADMPRIVDLVDQVDRLGGRGVVLFDAGGMRFAEPYTAPVMAALQRAGIPFVLDEEGLVRQMGERRRYDGSADLLVYVREGMEAHSVPPGAERIAFVSGIDADESAELIDLRRVVVERRIPDGVVDLIDPSDAVSELAAAAWRGEVDLEPVLGPAADRFIDLQYRWANRSVAIFAEPHRPSPDGSP